MKPLTRSLDNKMIAGVCSGIADSWNIDVTIVRVLFVVFAVTAGFAVIVYLALWIIMPVSAAASPEQKETRKDQPEREQPSAQKTSADNNRSRPFVAVLLIAAGVFVILSLIFHSILPLAGIALIFIGGLMLLKNIIIR